jgi:hypothetical protein
MESDGAPSTRRFPPKVESCLTKCGQSVAPADRGDGKTSKTALFVIALCIAFWPFPLSHGNKFHRLPSREIPMVAGCVLGVYPLL